MGGGGWVIRGGRERSGLTGTLGRWHVHVGQRGKGGRHIVLYQQTWDREEEKKETIKKFAWMSVGCPFSICNFDTLEVCAGWADPLWAVTQNLKTWSLQLNYLALSTRIACNLQLSNSLWIPVGFFFTLQAFMGTCYRNYYSRLKNFWDLWCLIFAEYLFEFSFLSLLLLRL